MIDFLTSFSGSLIGAFIGVTLYVRLVVWSIRDELAAREE